VTNFDAAAAADHQRYGRFFHHMLERGALLPPSGFELWTLGAAHSDADVTQVIDAAASFAG
jgi:glutamate-1-semialdehyde 2,1-aminomutase